LQITSEVDKGSCFTCVFPLVRTERELLAAQR